MDPVKNGKLKEVTPEVEATETAKKMVHPLGRNIVFE